ncbi:hypothetical protein BS639_19010 [Rouxiella silvae]|uniref:Acyltransferase n=1 Tax=Rouxiella silvae TaxID=1646373 RepID=A0AA40X4A8_9GAMM|nr:acyltransferase [Rouxiella silvae]MBF6638074.1 acyltransferase [Rouxiella silvae]ORJ19678.1 hypothetical protein BS639_19010 [Rouxiella silvae]
MKNRLKYLDGLRGIFALSIALSHFLGGAMGWNHYPFINAYIAVDFFFILSGFVLSYVYINAFNSSKIGNTQFSLHRLARMYPLHLATLIITFLIYYFLYNDFPFSDPTYSGVANLLALQGMGMTSDWSWNDPSWSISVELWASVLVFQVLARKFNNTSLFIFSFVCYSLVINKHDSLMAAFDFSYFYLSSGFLKCIGGMALGILLFKLSSETSVAEPNSTRFSGLIDLALFAIIMVFTCINVSMPKIDSLMVVCFAFLIYRLQVRPSWMRNLIETAPLNFLGKISFSLYLIHTPIILLLGRSGSYNNLPIALRMTIFLSITFAVSYILHVVFERELYKLLKKSIDNNFPKRLKKTVPLTPAL